MLAVPTICTLPASRLADRELKLMKSSVAPAVGLRMTVVAVSFTVVPKLTTIEANFTFLNSAERLVGSASGLLRSK